MAAMKTEFTLTQKRALAVATAVAILFGAYFLRGYFILIVVAAVAAYLFTPLFNRLNRRFGTGLSAKCWSTWWPYCFMKKRSSGTM